MPSFGDSAFIFILALILFGPKKLPELARQLGKLMAEFRRASNEFRMQMDEELRLSDQAEQQKKIAAMESAAPVAPALPGETEVNVASSEPSSEMGGGDPVETFEETAANPLPTAADPLPVAADPLPIASSGDLNLMPPSTGLPVESSSVSHAFDSVPRVADPDALPATDPSEGHTPDAPDHNASEAQLHG